MDKDIVASVNPDDFLGFKKVNNVKLMVRNYALDRLKSSPLHSRQIIHPDGTAEIPAVAREVLFPFLLSQEGNAVLLEPQELKEEFKKTLQDMLCAY